MTGLPRASTGRAGLPELAVLPLADDAAAALLDARAPGLAPALRERLLAVAAGNPLALTELPHSTSGLDEYDAPPAGWLTLTARLELAFSARLSGLPVPTRALLQVAALQRFGLLRAHTPPLVITNTLSWIAAVILTFAASIPVALVTHSASLCWMLLPAVRFALRFVRPGRR